MSMSGFIAKEEKKSSSQWFNLFKSKKPKIDEIDTFRQATEAADLIVHGGEKEVERALWLAEQNPKILNCEVVATDRLEREIPGFLIPIAAKVSETHLSNKILLAQDENEDPGLVNRLIAINHRKKYLSPESILNQLKVVTSRQAKLANAMQNKAILEAVKKFARGLMRLIDDDNFETACHFLATDYSLQLQQHTSKPHEYGFLGDIEILYETLDWFFHHEYLFGSSKIDRQYDHEGKWLIRKEDPFYWKKINAFLVLGFGKLQAMLPSRHAHFLLSGNFFHAAPRNLNNEDGTSYFDPDSGLGLEYCINIHQNGEKIILSEPDWTQDDVQDMKLKFSQVMYARNISLETTIIDLENQIRNRNTCSAM